MLPLTKQGAVPHGPQLHPQAPSGVADARRCRRRRRSADRASEIRAALCRSDRCLSRRAQAAALAVRASCGGAPCPARAMSLLHSMFGQHVPNVAFNHWEGGHFVSRCEICDCLIVRLPGLPWRRADAQQEARAARRAPPCGR